ncbi:MAG: hypothetical protein HYR85_02470 [Planctomycetes bacterium]|nr:hypothetical protein [Planctomycetota bacterium]MBI3846886.1 hypothetical protein [Planctomycetota bacterium]
MANRSLQLCLCGIGLLLGLAASAPARAQEFHLGAAVDRTGAGIVRYDVSGAPSLSHFAVLASFSKGVTKVNGLTFQGQTVPSFQIGLASPKQLVAGTTDAQGAAKGQATIPAGVVQRLKGAAVYFQAFAIRSSSSGSQKPRVTTSVSNVVTESGK